MGLRTGCLRMRGLIWRASWSRAIMGMVLGRVRTLAWTRRIIRHRRMAELGLMGGIGGLKSFDHGCVGLLYRLKDWDSICYIYLNLCFK